jgi:hypothetical protein
MIYPRRSLLKALPPTPLHYSCLYLPTVDRLHPTFEYVDAYIAIEQRDVNIAKAYPMLEDSDVNLQSD